MMDGSDLSSENNRKGILSQGWTRLSQVYQGTLDKWTPHMKFRWLGSAVLLAIFLLRVFSKQGWYIVTYALGIYHLNLFIAFLTPKIDPAMDFDDDENGPALPTRSSEEFRPFIRRLPEFKFWLSVTKSTLVGFCCTFIDAFNIPVFWPILVMYFITLFCITMKRQIKHMLKYRYLPFTHSKPKYKTVDSAVTFAYDIPLLGKGLPQILPRASQLHHFPPVLQEDVEVVSPALSGPTSPPTSGTQVVTRDISPPIKVHSADVPSPLHTTTKHKINT